MSALQCPAKVNLFLAIRGKDASGYHEIETVLARVPELFDELVLEPAEKFEFHCDTLPAEKNSVVQAHRLLEEKTGRPLHYKITLHKNIPPRSGLGGAASDAAALLLYMNEVESLGLTSEELNEIGAKIGMDVPFFLSGHEVALGTHYGERISPLTPLPQNLHIVIEFTGHDVSTPEAYAHWDEAQEAKTPAAPHLKDFLTALKKGLSEEIQAQLYNDFEKITPECGPYSPQRHLTGSGGAVFKLVD
jgi:4-diphosphocytidyl-2-C-methyl-D-erythritol kinase